MRSSVKEYCEPLFQYIPGGGIEKLQTATFYVKSSLE